MKKATTGFITLHRKMLDWEWAKVPSTFCLFVHLLLAANYTEGRFEGQSIKRGQILTSLQTLCDTTGLSMQQVRTALKNLILTGEITNESYARYRIITIVKYDEYQNLTYDPTIEQQSANKVLTNCQQSPNKQLTSCQQQYNNNNNNNKNNKNNKGTRTTQYTHSGDSFPEAFEAFWAVYPKKVAKQDALKAWGKLRLNDELINQIMASLARWAGSEQWSREGGRFIPNAATWLNGRRWEDEVRKEPAPAATVGRRVAAQEYSQRGYSSEHDDAMQRMIAMMQGREEP